MKRTVFCALGVLLCVSTAGWAQIRAQVAIVKSIPYADMTTTFERVADSAEKADRQNLADVYKAFAKGPRGSGFLSKSPDGSTILITNAHVAGYSDHADVVFETSDGAETTYRECKVLYTDPEVDIAILELPADTKGLGTPLAFSDTPPKDAQDVWSAGYPGLLSKQSWQIARGNVTNQHLTEATMINPARSYIIQHSAPIDPGSSGGPLLLRQAGDSFQVVGVNTWTVTDRENANFAIPVSTVEKVVADAAAFRKNMGDTDYLRKALETAARGFANEVAQGKADSGNGRDYIAYRFVSNAGWESYQIEARNSKPDDRDALMREFFTDSPFETMRGSLYRRIWSLVHTGDKNPTVSFVGIGSGDLSAPGTDILTTLTIGDKEYTFSWRLENGHWRISKTNMFTVAPIEEATAATDGKKKTADTDLTSGVRFSLDGGIGSFAPSDSGITSQGRLALSAAITGDSPLNNYLIRGIQGRYIRTGYTVSDSTGSIEVTTNLLQFFVTFDLRLPIITKSIIIAPGIGAGLGGSFSFGTTLSGGGVTGDSSGFGITIPAQVAARLDISGRGDPSLIFGLEAVYTRDLFGIQDTALSSAAGSQTNLLFGATFNKTF